MKNVGIFKENFDLAHKLSKLLNIKELNVVELPLYNSVQINSLVLSAAKESQMGGQQAVIEFSRNTKADQIMIIEEKAKEYKTETHFGGKLIKISIPEKEGYHDWTFSSSRTFPGHLWLFNTSIAFEVNNGSD